MELMMANAVGYRAILDHGALGATQIAAQIAVHPGLGEPSAAKAPERLLRIDLPRE